MKKILRLNFILKRSIAIADTIMQRERLKIASVDCDQLIFNKLFKAHELKEIEPSSIETMLNSINKDLQPKINQENGRPASSYNEIIRTKNTKFIFQFSGKRPRFPNKFENPVDIVIPSGEHTERNIALWNSITPVNNTKICPDLHSDTIEMEKIAAYNINSSADGRYIFKRKIGCHYRASQPGCQYDKTEETPFRQISKIFVTEDNFQSPEIERKRNFVRRRIGRGGRTVIDLKF